MATTYQRNKDGIYQISPFVKFSTWLGITLLTAICMTVALYLVDTRLLIPVAWAPFIALMVMKMVQVGYRLKKSKSFGSYFAEKDMERAITKNLLGTMTVNRLKDTPFISVPSVEVCDNRPKHIEVTIEKLAGMYDLEKLREDINASFRGVVKSYVVSVGNVAETGTEYKFVLENTNVNKAWRPATMEDLKQNKYELTLQNDLKVKLDENAHIAVWGQSGSGKSTVLLGIILQLFSMRADVYFLDGKDEFGVFGIDYYPEEKIAQEKNDVLSLLDKLLGIIDQRQKIMKQKSKEMRKMGLKASDVDFRPVVLIADEIGSLVALMDNKEQKQFNDKIAAYIQRGRSVGCSLIASTQDPSTDTLPQKVRQQFSTKILLGSTNSTIQTMAFGESLPNMEVKPFQGYYVSNGLTSQPEKFFVCNLGAHGFNKLSKFYEAFEQGKEVEYKMG